MSKVVCGKEAQYSEIIATSANQIMSQRGIYKNVVTRPPFPLGGLKGGLGIRLN